MRLFNSYRIWNTIINAHLAWFILNFVKREFKLTNPRAYLIVERFFLFFWQILRPISVVYSFNFFALKNLEVVAKAVCSIFNVWALALKNKRRIRRPGSLLVLHPKFTHWSRLKRKNSFYLWKCFIICIFFNGLVMLGSWFLKIVISLLVLFKINWTQIFWTLCYPLNIFEVGWRSSDFVNCRLNPFSQVILRILKRLNAIPWRVSINQDSADYFFFTTRFVFHLNLFLTEKTHDSVRLTSNF